MPSVTRPNTGLALALAALSALGGCSRSGNRSLDTATLERHGPDTQNLASIRPDTAALAVPSRTVPPESAEPQTKPVERTPEPQRTLVERTPDSVGEAAPDSQSSAAGRTDGSGALLATVPSNTPRAVPISRDSAEAEPAGTARALPAGTTIRATLQDSISSREQSSGDVVAARIRRAVKDRSGRVLLPAGSRVELSIAEIEPAKTASPEDARLVLRVDSILVDGRPHHVTADVQSVPYQLEGRGVTGKEAGKVGIGAAAGAVLGRVLSGKTSGAVVGGVVGAAGGAAVAARRARRDVVVRPGTQLVMVLKEPLVLAE